MSAIQNKRWTTEEYLAFERASDERHEFVDGEIYLMSGGSENHAVIILNAATSLHVQLRKLPCKVYAVDIRVRTRANYTYPDVTIVCGKSELEDNRRDTLLNPILIVEVLSPSTERYDRGQKFSLYREIVSLQEYVLISQDNFHVERFVRQKDDQWLFTDVRGIESVLELPSIGCTLALADVYDKVVFEATEPPPED